MPRRLGSGLIILIFTVSSLACRTVNEAKIVGVYRANASCVTITLRVMPDHTFEQDVRTSAGEMNRLAGKWMVDSENKMITFTPFLDFLSETRGSRSQSASFPPEAMGLGIEIGPVIVKCADSTHEINYYK